MKKKIIVFSDCDGTLLFDDYQFSDFTINTIKEMYESGNLLIPVTARTLKNLKNIAKQLKIDQLHGIIAANNGSQIYDFKNDKFILNSVLDKKVIKEIFDLYYKPNLTDKEDKVNFISEDIVYSYGESENTIKWATIMEQDFKVVTSADKIEKEISSISIVTKKGTTRIEFEEHLKAIKDKYGNDYRIDNYHNRVIAIAPKHIDKGYAVKKILEYLKPEEYTTYGFGDSYNDFSLLNTVDFGIAMKNGLLELQETAYDVTDYANYNDGVCRYLKDKNII